VLLPSLYFGTTLKSLGAALGLGGETHKIGC
jgi:hypothetical protein